MSIISELQGILAPRLEKLETNLDNTHAKVDEIKTGIKELDSKYTSLSDRIATLEGKYENAESTIMTRLENELLKGRFKPRQSGELPPE